MYYFYHLRHPEQWITRAGGISILSTTTIPVVSFLLLFLPNDIGWKVKIFIAITWVVAVVVSWIIFRAWYFRSGKGRRIAIAFHGYRTPIQELKRTRERITEAINDKGLRGGITIRLVPLSILKQDADKWIKKHGFDMACTVEVSKDLKNSSRNVYSLSITSHKSPVPEDVIRERINLMKLILERPMSVASEADLVDAQADRLFDAMLLLLAYHDLSIKKYKSASRLAHALDLRISENVSPKQKPRREVRMIDAMALTGFSQFNVRDLPNDPSVIEKASKYADLAIRRYGNEFPLCTHLEARNQFFLGNIDKAIALATSVDFTILNSMGKAYFSLDIAVLNLFKGNWANAAKSFQDFFDQKCVGNFNWIDLCDFADYASELDYQGAEYIACTYAMIKDGKCDEGIENSMLKWLWEDRSREPLRKVYESIKNNLCNDENDK